MPKVSVIVPVYNVEKYLEKCLNSLVSQTLDDIEIIVVNDGSPDNSQKIIDSFGKKYPKLVKGYIKENGGLSDARNYGLNYATGEYIGFVDSDDYVEPTMFEKMYNKAIEGNFDVVACDINSIEEGKTKYISSLVRNDLFTKNDIKKQMIDIYPVAWNKLYKKSLFDDGIRFKKNIWYEDVEFLYRLFPYITSIGVIKEPLINYVQRTGSISNVFDERLYNCVDNWNGIIEFYKKNNVFDEYYDELEYCYVRYLLATFIKNAAAFDKIEYNKAVNLALDNVHKYFPNYKKNKYLSNLKRGLYLKLFNKGISKIIYKKYH